MIWAAAHRDGASNASRTTINGPVRKEKFKIQTSTLRKG
jgi:hypothetical protein